MLYIIFLPYRDLWTHPALAPTTNGNSFLSWKPFTELSRTPHGPRAAIREAFIKSRTAICRGFQVLNIPLWINQQLVSSLNSSIDYLFKLSKKNSIDYLFKFVLIFQLIIYLFFN